MQTMTEMPFVDFNCQSRQEEHRGIDDLFTLNLAQAHATPHTVCCGKAAYTDKAIQIIFLPCSPMVKRSPKAQHCFPLKSS